MSSCCRQVNGAYLEAHGTGAVVEVDTLAPRVLAVHVAAVQVDVRRLV